MKQALRQPLAATVALLAAVASALPSTACQAATYRDAEIEALAARVFPTLTAAASAPDGSFRQGIAAMLASRAQRMSACASQPACMLPAAAWTAEERDRLASTVEDAARRGQLHGLPASDDGAGAAVRREVNGLNHVLEVYGQGVAPPYPEIDGPYVENGTPQARSYTKIAIALGETAPTRQLDRSVGFALALLDANDRLDAIRFDTLAAEDNGLALARARGLDWKRFAYTAIIVPGAGPDDLATPLSAMGKLRVRLAVADFQRGLAPYILLTGGAVHPRGAHYAEALEMRRALVERYGVPPDSILVEPYARHTTTNLRNAARRLLALGAPPDREALIVSNPKQVDSIASPDFAARNRRELGYEPGTIGARLSPTELAFRPATVSLRVDPMDPLDP